MRKLIIPFLFLATSAFATEDVDAEATEAVNCVQAANTVYGDFATAWSYAINEPGSAARDSIFSTWDYSKIYWEVMRRIPYREDRTRGVFLELRDRVNYSYQLARRTYWYDYRVYQWVSRGLQDTNYLSWCYGG